MTDRCCDDVAVHSHDGGRTLRKDGLPYTYRFKPGLNRYPGVVIGAGIVVGRRALGVVWGRPGRIVETSGTSRGAGPTKEEATG